MLVFSSFGPHATTGRARVGVTLAVCGSTAGQPMQALTAGGRRHSGAPRNAGEQRETMDALRHR